MDINSSISYKGGIISSLAHLVNILNEHSANAELIIVTSYGVICGLLDNEENNGEEENFIKIDETNNNYKLVSASHINTVLKLLESDDVESAFDRTSAIALKQVTIMPSSTTSATYKLDNLIVFADQIVGVSVGTLSQTN